MPVITHCIFREISNWTCLLDFLLFFLFFSTPHFLPWSNHVIHFICIFLLKVTVLNCLPSPYWVHIALYLTVWSCGILRTVKPHQCSKRRENNSVLSNPQEFWVIFLSKYFLLFWSRENMAVCGGVSEQQQQRHQWIWTSISCCHLNKGHSIFIKHL